MHTHAFIHATGRRPSLPPGLGAKVRQARSAVRDAHAAAATTTRAHSLAESPCTVPAVDAHRHMRQASSLLTMEENADLSRERYKTGTFTTRLRTLIGTTRLRTLIGTIPIIDS